jgi:hypothetical protein
VNRTALVGAFARTLRRLEEGAAGGAVWRPTGTVLQAARSVRVGVHWLRRPASSSLDDEGFGEPAAEKLAAELLWIGHKMTECVWMKEEIDSPGPQFVAPIHYRCNC